MKISKRNLILLILALAFCIVAGYWAFCIYRANKTINQLRSDDWQVRENAIQDFEKIGRPSVGPLITALKDENADIRWRAAYFLGREGDRRAVDPLITALKDEDRRVRARAIESLAKIGDPRSIEPLIGMFKDEDIDIQYAVLYAWMKIGKPAVGSLLVALKDEDGEIRWRAAHALGEINDSHIVEPLITALKDKDSRVRYRAMEALGKRRDSRAIEPLISALENEDWKEPSEYSASWAAIWALEKITGTRIRDPEKWKNWWEQNKEKYSTKNEN